MLLWNVGDKSEAICKHCKDVVSTTFAVRAVVLEDVKVTVEDVLVAVCDRCGETAGIPAQSGPLLHDALEKAPTKVIARVNRRLEDALRLIAAEYGVRDRDFRAPLLKYYLHEITRHPQMAKRIKRLAHSELVKGKKTGRVEFRLSAPALAAAWDRAKKVGMRTQTELIEGVIAAATEDILDHMAPERHADLERVAALV
jgi:RNase P subunit RPR2